MSRQFQFRLAKVVVLPLGVAVLCVGLMTFFGRRIDAPIVLGIAGGTLAWLACVAWLKPFKRD